MEYDINKFADEFKNTINWMLNDRFGKKTQRRTSVIEK